MAVMAEYPQALFQGLDSMLTEAISLGMMCGREAKLDVKFVIDLFPENGSELRPAV